MENNAKQEKKAAPCYCTMLAGVLVIVFAWWQVAWSPIALTVLGLVIMLKEFFGNCCCSTSCKS